MSSNVSSMMSLVMSLMISSVMSLMMSWLWFGMCITMASTTSVVVTASGLVGSAGTSTLFATSPLVSDSYAKTDAVQSTEGLSVSQASISSALVANSNASTLPTSSSSFALTSAPINPMHSFRHHALITSGPAETLFTLPTGAQPSSLLSNPQIEAHVSSSSLSFQPTEMVASSTEEQTSQLMESTLIELRDVSDVRARLSDVFVRGTESRLDWKTTESFGSLPSLAPSPSEPMMNTAHQHESTGFTPNVFTSGQILPSYDVYSETLGVPVSTFSGSSTMGTSERRTWSMKTPDLLNSNQMSEIYGSMDPLASDYSLNPTDLSDEERPVYTYMYTYTSYEEETSNVVTIATPTFTFRDVPPVSNDYVAAQSSHIGSAGQTSEVVATVTPSISRFHFPVSVDRFRTSFLPHFPDTSSPSYDAESVLTSYAIETQFASDLVTGPWMQDPLYGTSVSGNTANHQVVVSTALHERQLSVSSASLHSDDALALLSIPSSQQVTVTSYGNPSSYLNVQASPSLQAGPSVHSFSGQALSSSVTRDELDPSFPTESGASLSPLPYTSPLHSYSSSHPALLSSYSAIASPFVASAFTRTSSQSPVEDNLDSVLTPSQSMPLTSLPLASVFVASAVPPSALSVDSSFFGVGSAIHSDRQLSQTSQVPVSIAVSASEQLQSDHEHSPLVNSQSLRLPDPSLNTAEIHSFDSLMSHAMESSSYHHPSSVLSSLSHHPDLESVHSTHLSNTFSEFTLSSPSSLHAEITNRSPASDSSLLERLSHQVTSLHDRSYDGQTENLLTFLPLTASHQVQEMSSIASENPASSDALTRKFTTSASPVSNLTPVMSALFNEPSTAILQAAASLSLHASPAFSSISGSRLSDAVLSTRTPQLTASYLLQPSQDFAADSSMLAELSSLSFSQLLTSNKLLQPVITASLSLHASRNAAVSDSLGAQSSDEAFDPVSQTGNAQPSSRGLAPATSETVAMTTSSVTYPTLDRSFSTNVYWLEVDITVPENVDIKGRGFVVAMETGLATAYSEGKRRRDERLAAVEELLGNLNPDNDPLLAVRSRRAVTEDGNTAQVIDLSRNTMYPVNVVLVFYIAEGDTSMAAGESKAIFSELTLQEITFYLQVVVKSSPVEYIEPVVITTTPAPSLDVLWIFLGVLGGLSILACGCCCCFCICCRRPLKPSKDGPMDIDTLKMLQHKQKYPYKPYKSPNQTPRGFDVAKETDGARETGVAGGSGSRVRLQSSATASILKNQLNTINVPRFDDAVYSSSSSSASLSGNLPDVPPLELNSLRDPKSTEEEDGEEDAFHKATSSLDLDASGTSQRLSGDHRPRLLPLRPQVSYDGDQWSHKPGEADELRRIYREAQREISRVLEPDVIPDQSTMTYVSPDIRTKKSSTKKKKPDMQETEFGGAVLENMLPDTHYARTAGKKQNAARRQPEALQDARRKVHNLIDEAFSLVGLPKNAVSPAPRPATKATPLAADEEEPPDEVKDKGCETLLPREALDFTASSAKGMDRSKREPDDQGTRVVVVPVAHQPIKTADVVWNPYNAEDELAQLEKSHQLTSVSGRVEFTHIPHHTDEHLTMPHPVSVPEPSRDVWLKEPANLFQTEEQTQEAANESKLLNNHDDEESLIEHTRHAVEGRPSTALRRQSTDSETKLRSISPSDPYLDPYLRRSISGELNGTFTLSPRADGQLNVEEDPYAVALTKPPKKDSGFKQADLAHQNQPHEADMLSTLPKEHRVGKPVDDGYDEFDISRNVSSKENSGQLVEAIREELMRLAKRSGQHGSSS